MRIPTVLTSNRLWRATLVLALGYFMTGTYAQAQCSTMQGFNTVYGLCNSTNQQGSIAPVDASQLPGTDICTQIQNSFQAYLSIRNTYGIVVDARGINPGTTQVCTGGALGGNPWANWGTIKPGSLPSVVLLPAGIIQISKTWVMPQLARLVGEGPGLTILQATTNLSEMIDMGPSSASNSPSFCALDPNNGASDCPGVAIEHLGLDGNSSNVTVTNGIVNYYAQELSYVDDVAFSNIKGTALSLTVPQAQDGNWQNSGPYSNLTMSNVGTCVNITGSSTFPFLETRGIHGLNCSTSNSSTSQAAIYVDGPGNSLEDISLQNNGAITDGILIGDSHAAQNNVLFNIRGSGFTNLIHISSSHSSTQVNCPAPPTIPATAYNVCDITIMGVTNGTTGSGITTLNDEVGGASLTDANLGMYILGEPVQYGDSNGKNDNFLGYAHFTTSPNWPTWVVGSTQTTGSSCPGLGSLFSATSGSSGTLWECDSSGWQLVK
jgi:hypothetical protein